MIRLLIATNNQGKVVEILDLLSELADKLQILTPSDLNIDLDVVEDGADYAENAARKALAFARASGCVSLADDSGLEVDALNGEPGLHSARYSPEPGATDADRRVYLLKNLQGFPRPWKAKFHCTVALAHPDGTIQFATGECYGEVIPEERGEGGFGYDSIFWLPALGCTMAELSREQKNALSHRARAIKASLPFLKSL